MPLPLLRAAAAQIAMLAAAALGGFAFTWLGVPAAWLSGAMMVTAALAAAGVAPVMPAALRDMAMLIAGVSMGAAVTPESLGALSAYPASLLILALSLILMMMTSMTVLVKMSGWAPKDAFFASAPGALSAVLIIAVEQRADVAKVAIVQLFRLFVLVMILPPVIAMLEPPHASAARIGAPLGAAAFTLLFAVSLATSLAFEKLRITAPFILGAMIASAALTGPGVIQGRFPPEVATVGFILIGVFIGQRFRGMDGASVLRLLPAACVSLLAALVVATLGAAAVSLATGIDFGSTIVAFAPGGLEAMTVLAFVLGLDTIYVGVHHIARFLLVGLMVPFAVSAVPRLRKTRLLPGRAGSEDQAEGPSDLVEPSRDDPDQPPEDGPADPSLRP